MINEMVEIKWVVGLGIILFVLILSIYNNKIRLEDITLQGLSLLVFSISIFFTFIYFLGDFIILKFGG